jgi:hypothetical protein
VLEVKIPWERLGVAFVVGAGRGQVGTSPRAQFLFAAAIAAVEPDLVAAAAAAVDVVAGAQVLDAHAFGLEHLQAVTTGGMAFGVQRPEVLVGSARTALGGARLRTVEHDPVAFHATDVDPGLLDEHRRPCARTGWRLGSRFFVVARSDQDPVAGARRVDGLLDGLIRARGAVEVPHVEHARRGRCRPGDSRDQGAADRRKTRSDPYLPPTRPGLDLAHRCNPPAFGHVPPRGGLWPALIPGRGRV